MSDVILTESSTNDALNKWALVDIDCLNFFYFLCRKIIFKPHLSGTVLRNIIFSIKTAAGLFSLSRDACLSFLVTKCNVFFDGIVNEMEY